VLVARHGRRSASSAMPELPKGEQGLRQLASRFEEAEAKIRELIARAPAGDRRPLLLTALEVLVVLRALNMRFPIYAAYLYMHPDGSSDAVDDLARSLHGKLENGLRRAQEGSRRAFRFVTDRNIDVLEHEAVTAHEAVDGTRWTLGSWASMNTQTIGRTATSRGIADAVGKGGKVTISVGECGWCREHAGEAVIGQDPLPPFHPSCTCTASPA
jgi:hypothetical protein